MSALFLLMPISVVLIALIAWALYWAIGSGQFDDLDGPAYRVLMDDDGPGRGSENAGANASRGIETTGDDAPARDGEVSSLERESARRSD